MLLEQISKLQLDDSPSREVVVQASRLHSAAETAAPQKTHSLSESSFPRFFTTRRVVQPFGNALASLPASFFILSSLFFILHSSSLSPRRLTIRRRHHLAVDQLEAKVG